MCWHKSARLAHLAPYSGLWTNSIQWKTWVYNHQFLCVTDVYYGEIASRYAQGLGAMYLRYSQTPRLDMPSVVPDCMAAHGLGGRIFLVGTCLSPFFLPQSILQRKDGLRVQAGSAVPEFRVTFARKRALSLHEQMVVCLESYHQAILIR